MRLVTSGTTSSRVRTLLCGASLVLGLCALIPMRCASVEAAERVAVGQAPAAGIAGTWQGTLHVGKDLRVVLKIETGAEGAGLKSTFYSIDQNGAPTAVKTTTFAGGVLALNVDSIGGEFAGKMSADGTTITGEWTQGKPLPLILVRATPETAWAIPEPPKKLPPMAADADPSLEIATIKLTPADFRGKGFGGPPGTFQTRGTTLNDLIVYAYRVHFKQISGGPDWLDTTKFDVTGKPDTPGQPTDAQSRVMTRKLLASRFGLKFHEEKKEMSAFVLTVAKSGAKMEASEADANGPIGFGFRDIGNLVFRNITMPNFASWMQTVLDRPVVDHTGLEGRFNGTLKWNPDETQFAVFGVTPHPSTAADAPPDLFKAIQEQIGLKLETGKPQVTVMVLDHVDKPSDD